MKINNKFNSNKFSIILPLMLSLLLIMSVVLSISIVEAAPEQRIVSLAPSNTEILFEIGAGDRVVGVTLFCDYPPEAANIKKVGGFWPPNPELIVNVSPTIIFAKPHHRRLIEGINKTHITVFIEEKNVEDIYRNIEYIGTRTGNSDKARELVGRMRSRVRNIPIVPTERKPTVLYAISHDPIWVTGPDTFVGEVIEIAGGINVVKEGRWFSIGTEPIISKNPRIIITSTVTARDGILANPALSRIDAVRNRRVIAIRCENVISRPGPRIVDGIEDMHAIIIQNLIPEIPDRDPGVTPPTIRKELIETTPVAPAIIEVEESVEIKTTKANVPVSIDIKKTNITEITITTLRDVSNIPLRVQQLTERPAEVPEIPDKIYRYFSITTGIKSEDIDNATITFNVSKSWINEINISIGSIRLNRFNTTNKQWDALPTKLIRKDVNNITFSAETPHFSIFSVTGKKIVPTRINVTPITATLNVTETRQFTATVLPADANQTVTWSVTNETVGTINATGFFTARAIGTTNVTARSVVDANITITATITVVVPTIVTPPALTRINVTPTTATLNVTETRQFTATVLPADANQTVTWSVTNETVGTINATGFFTARARGTVNVITTSVVDRNITGTATVTVVPSVKPEPAPRTPGFGLVSTIIGILGVILILKKKK